VAEVVASRVLSSSQLELLAAHGEQRTAAAGEQLYRIGDRRYPFMAILEGEAAVLDGEGNEIVRHGPSGFLGEISLLTGQTVFVNAVAVKPMRYIAVEREELRELLFDNVALSDLLMSSFIERREALQLLHGTGVEIVGDRNSADTRRLLDYVRKQRIPYSWEEPVDPSGAAHSDPAEMPSVRLPGDGELHNPSNGQLSRALGIGLELAPREEVDLLIIGGGPAGLGAAVYGASEGLDTLVIEASVLGGQAGTSRRIENYLGFPAGISGTELTGRAITQARKFGARVASPYRAQELQIGSERHVVKLEEGHDVAARAVLLATGAEYRRLPVEGLEHFEGVSVFYAAGPLEGQQCGGQRVGVVGGGNSAGQAAVWLARGGALVTLLHRRADLAETMSQYLIDELDRYGVSVRDRSEIASLQGSDGQLQSVTLSEGSQLPFSDLFLFLGGGARRQRLHPHRHGGGRRGRPRNERRGRVRRRGRARNFAQALCDRGRRGRRCGAFRTRPYGGDGTRSCGRRQVIVALGDISAKIPRLEDVRRVMRDTQQRVREQPGCVSYAFAEALDDPGHFVVVAEWQDLAALEGHYRSEDFADYQAAIAPLLVRDTDMRISETRQSARPVADSGEDPDPVD
jgi:thioredoxin reductase (NADPH)